MVGLSRSYQKETPVPRLESSRIRHVFKSGYASLPWIPCYFGPRVSGFENLEIQGKSRRRVGESGDPAGREDRCTGVGVQGVQACVWGIRERIWGAQTCARVGKRANGHLGRPGVRLERAAVRLERVGVHLEHSNVRLERTDGRLERLSAWHLSSRLGV
ncbi:hypothetical protein CRG98_030327 [Punica granatum]|uniref:Uncharacterized protein n=1 Tax=Punica granatum TaxID=22663 RepID=A0A2I0IZ76_PUNGR|nr:hypothetical protein CRG98_030327 [Punica granatum]